MLPKHQLGSHVNIFEFRQNLITQTIPLVIKIDKDKTSSWHR
ncbi:hypothetical protein DYY67_2200 [Candidatus Nitrosotalea sp. TS]|nr:hypothetical protein [Candidatus Nitrosotalea sp. TS]